MGGDLLQKDLLKKFNLHTTSVIPLKVLP